MKICEGCPLYSENKKKTGWTTFRPDEHCTDCGCPLVSKSKCLHCECPLKKWLAVTTEEEEDKIKDYIDGR